MCREVCELVKTFLFPPIAKQLDQTTTTTGTTPSIGATTSMSSISMDENGVDNTDLEQMSTKDGEGLSGGSGGVTALVSSNFLSDMAIVLLKTNKNIYQSTLLILFEGTF